MMGGAKMHNKKTFILILSALAIALNIVLGTVVGMLNIPLIFLDTIGTIFIAALAGPWYGAVVGALTNIIQGMLTNPKDIPFLLVNVAVGIIVGFISKKYKFDIKAAIITGLILSVICPLIGTPIAVWIYGGITGSGNDFIFAWLRQTGHSIFTSAFIPRITGNIIDKVVSCALVSVLISKIPSEYKNKVSSSI
jgi:energy-coupling factor transport system substrate-specific component